MQARRSLRVEWYVVILIVFEILLTLYQMFWLERQTLRRQCRAFPSQNSIFRIQNSHFGILTFAF